MKLTRITWSREQPGKFMVETGDIHELTSEEEAELSSLRDQLEQYGDFVNLGDIPPEEMDELFKAKARRGELESRSSEQITWAAKPEDEVRSIVLVLQPQLLPVYVENLPGEWIDKIFNSVIIQTAPTQSEAPPPSPPIKVGLGERIRTTILAIDGTPKFKDAKNYLDCIDMEEVEGRGHGQPASHIRITPKKFLEDDWKPINDMLSKVFGKKLTWTTEGKSSHWKIWK